LGDDIELGKVWRQMPWVLSDMRTIIAILACVFLAACGGGKMTCTGPTPACNNGSPLQSVTVSSPSKTLILGGIMQFTAAGHYQNGSMVNITSGVLWSTDSQVALITSQGIAVGEVPGTVSITASAGPITGFETVTVP
jgi:Bacterial Ig-like domain (group 2)